MAEESSQQFTSTGTTSARNVSPTKASSVRPVNRQPIKQVASNTQSPQTKYIYAGIGEQPLTQREFDENLKNLRNILSECDSLLQGDMKNPENVKRCQQLLGFATSLRLPQEVKDKEIRSYPPAVQHLYETVKNEGSSASPAAQMAQTRHATTAMAQIMASDLRHETILKDLQTMDIDAVYDKYYAKEKFVRVLEKDVCPQTKWVEGSNYVDVNFKLDPRTGRVIMMGAMDNLVKGAAGQAVQNMNLMFGLKEGEGLELVPMFP